MTLSLDGEATPVSTYAPTVADALDEYAVVLHRGDVVRPDPATPLTDGLAVSVTFRKDFRLRVGQREVHHRSVAAVTVAGALRKLGVPVDGDDRVSPGGGRLLESGQRIIVDRIHFRKIVHREPIAKGTVHRRAPHLYRGQHRVARPGENGRRKIVLERKVVNGDVAYTRTVGREVLRKPHPRVILDGTKSRPTATLSGVWKALAQCESGGNRRAVGGGGAYYGLFQFSPGTWHSVGGSGIPTSASVAEQVKRAKILQARSGWGQWPYCSAKLGLR